MKFISIIVIFSALVLFYQNCSSGFEPYNIVTLNDGKIQQPSDKLEIVSRLHFSLLNNKVNFKGSETVESFSISNVLSLPPDEKEKYYGYVFLDNNEEAIHKGIIKKFNQHTSQVHEDYLVRNISGHFYLELPEVNLDELDTIVFTNLDTAKAVMSIKIEDPKLEYEKSVVDNDGWNQEFGIFKVFGDKASEEAFDIVILTEGFDTSEISINSLEELMASKFGQKLQEIVLPVFEGAPFSEVKDILNVWIVATPSEESGVDVPSSNTFKKTVFGATFGAYCLDRALIVREQERALEIASKTPFDQVIVMVNSEVYGGIGSEIATFSMNKQAPNLIRHELAHSIALFADEYKYSSDRESIDNCKDYLAKELVVKKDKLYGVNSLQVTDELLAPNLSLFSTKEEVKWSSSMLENSPIVFFDYPIEDITFEPEGKSINAKYKLQNDVTELRLLFGQDKKNNLYANNIEKITVNNKIYDFTLETPGDYIFIKVVLESVIGKSMDVELIMEFKEKVDPKTLVGLSKNRNFLTVASETFLGTIDEIGIFQGGGPSLSKTFRSSYVNKMSLLNADFNSVQKNAFESKIRVFGGKVALD